MMAEQAQPNLPEGVERRVKPEHAAQFVVGDQEAGVFYDENGDLRPEEEFVGTSLHRKR